MPGRSDYEERMASVALFNENNMFKKKGLSLVPMRWRHRLDSPIKMAVQVGFF